MMVDPQVVKETRYFATLLIVTTIIVAIAGLSYRAYVDGKATVITDFQTCLSFIPSLETAITPEMIIACNKVASGEVK